MIRMIRSILWWATVLSFAYSASDLPVKKRIELKPSVAVQAEYFSAFEAVYNLLEKFKDKTPEDLVAFLEKETEYVLDHVNPANPGVAEGKKVCDFQLSVARYIQNGFKGDCDDKAHFAYAVLQYLGYEPELIDMRRQVQMKTDSEPGPCDSVDGGMKVEMHRANHFMRDGIHCILDDNGIVEEDSLFAAVQSSGYSDYRLINLNAIDILFREGNLDDLITERSFYSIPVSLEEE